MRDDDHSDGPLVPGIDVSALLARTQGVDPKMVFGERKDEGMPADLRPDVKALPVRAQITRLWGAYVIWSGRRPGADDHGPEVVRVQRIVRMYQLLRAGGYLLDDVTGLRKKHVEALLDIMRSRGYTISTIRANWSTLRKWCNALGKPNLMGLIEEYWSDAPQVDRKVKRTAQQRHEIAHGDFRVHSELRQTADRTHWYIEQLCTQLRLTTHEAVRFSPGQAGDYTTGVVKVRSGRRDAFRMIVLASEQDRTLVKEVIEFIFSKNRKSLGWPEKSPGESVRKHQQRLSYVRRKLARHSDGAGAAASDEAGGDGADDIELAAEQASAGVPE